MMSQNRLKKRKTKTFDRKINVIINRLMEISLQADNYIYSHQPLSVHKASSYLREVLSFQTSCWNDERCLQVIEKLARIMQGIIQEQDTHQKHASLNNQQENFGGLGSSPVYSLPDEDKLELTCKNANINTEYHSSNYKYKSPNQMHSSKEMRPYNQTEKNKIEIADLQLNTKDTETKNTINDELNYVKRQDTVNTEFLSCNNYIQQIDDSDEEIAMIINDLTLIQKDIQLQEDNFLCSQSILNNESLVQTLIMDEEQCGQGISEFDKEVNKLLNSNQTTTSIHEDTVCCVQNEVNGTNDIKAHPYGILPKTQTYNNFNNNALKSQAKKIKNKKSKRKTLNTNANTENNKAKPKNKDKNKKNKKVFFELTTVTPKNIFPLKESTPSTNKTDSLREDTLSWLGNIKLVREVDIEEYSVNTLNESFWENCEIPADWDDKHFD